MVCSVQTKVAADPDYFQALNQAQSASTPSDMVAALQALEAALRKYPRDYALTLERAHVQLLLGNYVAAARSYRDAIILSDGAIDPRVGLGWALLQQARCDRALPLLQGVLMEAPDEASAREAVAICTRPPPPPAAAEVAEEPVHATTWLALAGSLYREHPWKQRSGDAVLGFHLRPTRALGLGAVYRYLALTATDPRVSGFNQHELYGQAAYTGQMLDLTLYGAMIWSGDALAAGSRHAALAARYKYMPHGVGDLSLEVAGSYYRDLWVLRVAVAWTVGIGPLVLTPAVAAQKFARDTLASGGVTLSLPLGVAALWISGKVGSEFRAAYLSQSAVFNAEDHSRWSAAAGAQLRPDGHWTLFASYLWIRLATADGLPCDLHIVSVGTSYAL